MTSKKYRNAFYALYGDSSQLPATSLSPKLRSSNLSKPRKPRRNIERGLQIRLVDWVREQGWFILMIGNEGQRSRIGGHIAKQMGLYPGASDLLLTHVCGGYGAYFIELKRPGEMPRENQLAFLDEMRRKGYKAEWFDDLEKAKQSIRNYIENGL